MRRKPSPSHVLGALIHLAGWVALVLCTGGTAATALAGPSRTAPRPPQDRRQKVRITLDVTGEPLVDLLKQLSTMSGLQLTSAEELGERRVHVIVRDRPLSAVRTALADVTHGAWRLTGGGTKLHMEPDQAARRDFNELLARRKRAFFSGLHALRRNLALDQRGLEHLRQTDRAAATYLTDPACRAAVQFTNLLSVEQWQLLEATGQLSLSADQLGAQGRALLRDYAHLIAKASENHATRSLRSTPAPPPLDVDALSGGWLQLRVVPHFSSGAPYSYLSVALATELESSGMVITGSEAANGPHPRWESPVHSVQDGAPSKPPATLRFAGPFADWGTVLRQIAREFRLNVVSEEFTRPADPSSALPREIVGTVAEILDRLCLAFGYEWRMRDGVYQFRSSTWYRDRNVEPPGTLIKGALVARRQKRPLSLEWLAVAARATAGGRTETMRRLCVYAPAARPLLAYCRDLLEFYASMSAEQRAQMQMAEGIAVNKLSLEQYRLLRTVQLDLADDYWSPEDLARARVLLTRDAVSARFTIATDGKSVGRSLSLPFADAPVAGGPGTASPVPQRQRSR